MPAHVKASLLGPSLTLPISRGRLALGTCRQLVCGQAEVLELNARVFLELLGVGVP
jgi:thiamine phosphate synthase YjbQ (UPF0047 family)